MNLVQSPDLAASMKQRLRALCTMHACADHPLFEALQTRCLSVEQGARLLKNYDAHASVLRRLLLKAATLMPEPAVGFVLENVRNEYGNGDYKRNHQYQLQDVASQIGIRREDYDALPIMSGIKQFISQATSFYAPACGTLPKGINQPACVAGAITATEVLAIKEFRALQQAFTEFGLEHHIWFHHVAIEEDHSDESLALAIYFIENELAQESVEFGMNAVLDANVFLYDGLLAAIS